MDKKSTISDAAAAAAQVNEALAGLEPEDRARVLASAAALSGITSPGPRRVGEPVRPEDEGGEGGQKGQKQVSLGEFVKEKAPATNSQRIAIFAYYREHYQGKTNFSRGDLLPYFATAKIGKPGNYGRDFSEAVKESWIHEEGSDSYLTATGASAVEGGFAGKAKPRGVAVSKKKA